jgi:transposase
METYQIPRRKIAEHLGVSRSTVYRWLHKIQDDRHVRIPANKTPTDIVALVWEIAKSNMSWGRVRIANQMALLNVFISASTVRNILQKPKHPVRSSTKKEAGEKEETRSIPAWYPNHVWSIDTTEVMCWGLWPVYICIVIDHFSRKVVA